MIKCELKKDFQTFAQHGCQNWRKSYIPKKKKDSDLTHSTDYLRFNLLGVGGV